MGELGPERRAAEDGVDAPEPTHSEARARRLEPGERRASVRPSAFGAPHKSVPPARTEPGSGLAHTAELPPPPPEDAAPELLKPPSSGLSESGELPRLPNQRARGVEHLVQRGSLDANVVLAEPGDAVGEAPREALPTARAKSPIAPAASSATASSAARAAQVGELPVPALPTASPRAARRPWLSVALFASMMALSLVPLLRYTGAIDEQGAASGASGARALRSASALAPNVLPVLKPVSAGADPAQVGAAQREQTVQALLSEGAHAIDAGETRAAERLFGRVLELADDNPRAAYGLARIRLIQNNLSGAEGWIQLALRKRPRRASYHALYAEVLTRMGRITEAREEQARAGTSRDSDD